MEAAWFVATIILKCKVAGEPVTEGEWTCIQQIHVIRAVNREVAYEKALEIGKAEGTSYLNDQGQLVRWEFVGLENVEELQSQVIRDGTEIWGRVFNTNDPEALVVEKEGLAIFHNDEIKDLTAREILENGMTSKLICNRVEN